MSEPTSPDTPSVTRYVLQDWRDEAIAMVILLRTEWRVLLALLCALVAGVVWLDPLPAQTLRMAKGQPGSGLEVMAVRYRDALAQHGVTLELVPSGGAVDNLRMVSEGQADISLSQSGLPAPAGIHYLGSVAYQPLWLFHDIKAHAHRDLPGFLSGKTVSIGIPGSGSQSMSERLLEELSPSVRARVQQTHLNNPDTVAALRDNRIDAAFLLASTESDNAQALIWAPGVDMYNFAHAEGIARRWGFAEAVTLPAGALTLSPLNPTQDVHMVAVTMTLVVSQRLHPATQQLLLSISQNLASQTKDVFDRPGRFPRFVDHHLPRSPVAERFYSQGAPALNGRLPYWLVHLIDSLWFGIVTLLAVAYPLSRIKPNYRQLLFDSQAEHIQHQLDTLEARLSTANPPTHMADMASVEKSARQMRVPHGCQGHHHHLLTAVEALKSRLHPPAPEPANTSRLQEVRQPRRFRPLSTPSSRHPGKIFSFYKSMPWRKIR